MFAYCSNALSNIFIFFIFYFSLLKSILWIAIGSTSLPFMEVVKAKANKASLASKSTALRIEKKSYSYAQLIESAWHISNLLCSSDLDSVSIFLNFVLIVFKMGKISSTFLLNIRFYFF